MGKIYELERKAGKTILARVLDKPKVINGKLVDAGNIEVVAGMNNEEYWFTPQTGHDGYHIPSEMEEELKKAKKE